MIEVTPPPELTPEQQAIVSADCDGPRLVDAGAGTGKTFTMVERARALIANGFAPDALLIVTFTKAAANEIAERLESVLPLAILRRPAVGTFHGIAGDLLREFAYAAQLSPDIRVIDDARARGIFARAFGDLEEGRLNVDLQSFPLIERRDALERSLAKIAIDLKAKGVDLVSFRATALAQADLLEHLSFGGVKKVGKKGQVLAGWPRPDPERTPSERRAEAAHERRNIDVVVAVFARFQALLDASHLLTFGDVIIGATRMLHAHPQIATLLRARWRHAIVDEFQDTNGTQIALLEAIFGSDLRPVLAVGDVRQSIFEFNGAEPQGIIDFAKRARQTLPLGENRRSVQPILDLADHAYGELSKSSATGSSMAAGLRARRGGADARVVRVQSFGGANAREREATAVAADVHELIHERGVEPRDIAVLMRSRTRAHLYADALGARGIPTQLLGGAGFFEAPEIREVIAWARLAVDPSDAFAVVAALQSAAVHLGDGVLTLLAAGGDLPRAALIEPLPASLDALAAARIERFRATARHVVALGDVPLVEALRAIILASGGEIARRGTPEIAAQAQANLDQLLRIAVGLSEDVTGARLREFVIEIDEREALELDLAPAQLPGERVSLVTIHGSKGLEWDHVYVVDVAPQAFPLTNNDARDVVATRGPDGALALKHGVDGRPTLRWFCTQIAHDDAGTAIERSVSKEEEYRLFYVALTRARDRVTITGRRSRHDKESACIGAARSWIAAINANSDDHRLIAGDDAPLIDAQLAMTHAALGEIERLGARLRRITETPRLAPQRLGLLSYSAMEMQERCPRRARYHYVLGLPEFDIDVASVTAEQQNGPTIDRRRFGSIVHRALEFDARARIDNISRDLPTFIADAVAEENGTQAEATAAEPVVRAAAAELEAYEPIDAERHFTIEIDGVKLGGYIDLIARDRTGTLYVIDYKTGYTSADHYALQFALYARAVRETEGVEPRTLLLRIGQDGVIAEHVTPANDATLCAAVALAGGMTSDQPRPGNNCRYCPYARDVCHDAAVA